MGRCVVRIREKMNSYRLVGKPEGKRPLGRPRCRRVDRDRMEGIGSNGLPKDTDKWRALVNAAMNLCAP
jgi:hypothetical protein